MKRLLCVSLMLVAGTVFANDLNEANKLLNAKEYGKAFPVYARLAESGNAQAQLRLGEMYWFGEGTKVDLKKAALLFQQSASAGNKDAADALAALKRRETRGNEIGYWMSQYQGEDLVGGMSACTEPSIPALSKSNAEIKKVSADIESWEACYNNAVANVRNAMPVLKHVPKDVLDMMTPAEIEGTQAHLDKVFAKVIASMSGNASAVLAQRDAWTQATNSFVLAENKRVNERLEQNVTAVNIELRRAFEARQALLNAPIGPKPIGH